MIPVTITLRQDDPQIASKALSDLAMALEQLSFRSIVEKSSSRDGEIQRIFVTPDVLNSHYITEFIKIIFEFISRFPELDLELDYGGNKVRVDKLSIDRAAKDIRRLTERSFSITGNDIVIGSNNEVAPLDRWPRRKD